MKKQILKMTIAAGMIFLLTGCSKPAVTQEATSAEVTTAGSEADPAAGNEADAEEGAGEKPAVAGTVEEGKLIVGFDQEFPPMGFKGDDGEYTGFDLDLAREAAERLGLEMVPQPIDWASKDMELSSGNIDCIWNGFTMNGRENDYTWSEPYMDNSQVVVVKEDSGIETLADLTGKVVEVQADSSAEAALAEMNELTSTFKTLQTTPDYNTAFMDLEMGAVDAIAMDVIVAGYQINERKVGYKTLDETLASEKYGIGFKQGNEALRDQVQGALEEMAADGTLKSISEDWFGMDVTIIK